MGYDSQLFFCKGIFESFTISTGLTNSFYEYKDRHVYSAKHLRQTLEHHHRIPALSTMILIWFRSCRLVLHQPPIDAPCLHKNIGSFDTHTELSSRLTSHLRTALSKLSRDSVPKLVSRRNLIPFAGWIKKRSMRSSSKLIPNRRRTRACLLLIITSLIFITNPCK